MEPLVHTSITSYFAVCSLQGPWELQPWALSWTANPLQHSSRYQRCRVKSRHVRAKGELQEGSFTIVQSKKQQHMGCLKEVQVLGKAEKMHGLSESLADGIVTIYEYGED